MGCDSFLRRKVMNDFVKWCVLVMAGTLVLHGLAFLLFQ